jgi:type I restriction enzyme S subunit
MEFATRTLGEICDEVDGVIQTGPFGSQLHQSDYRDEGTPVVMPKDLAGDRVSVESIARIGDEDVERLARHKLETGDIVYARRGDIGRRALITGREAGWMCVTGCMRISLGDTILNPRFLFYYLGQPDIVTWIYNQAVGATMPNLNTSIVRSVPVKYPPLPSQHKIAAVLSAYDDLIENNTRRIAVLEEMARLLYQEWFVRFRFPGHEDVAMVDSELGPVPEGWEVKKLGEIAEQVRRSVRPDEVEPQTPYIGLEHMPRRSIALSDWGRVDETKSTKLVFHRGEILFGKIRPYFHKVGVAPVDGVSSTDAIVIVPKPDKHFSLVLACVSSDEFVDHATQTSQGTKMPRADWNVLVKYPVCIPPEPILSRFSELVEDIVAHIQNAVLRNRTLRRTRDLLLPRLVSGQVDVSALEIDVS